MDAKDCIIFITDLQISSRTALVKITEAILFRVLYMSYYGRIAERNDKNGRSITVSPKEENSYKF